MNSDEIRLFQEKVWNHYHLHARWMPWREQPTPYYVLVSELMLQQTQVSRVISKFEQFIERFPDFDSLASASLADVLSLWSGLGYNRRAKFLHEAARMVVARGTMPDTLEDLMRLPGVGRNTAAAILNYAFEVPTPFVETNIRTVYFHESPTDAEQVDDKTVLGFVENTMDHVHPRDWFYALMDYGAILKVREGGKLDRSKHYKKQPPLQGSLREMRGRLLKVLAGRVEMAEAEVKDRVSADERYEKALEGLIRDGLVERRRGGWLCLTGAPKAS